MEKTIPLNNIKPNSYNPNEMTSEQFEELVKEVKHLGKPPKPIILRNKGEFFEIVDGEHSYRALRELNYQELQESWYEIVDYDDIEAKRQTYKRNLGGTNNPVKLGQMFAKTLQESGMSNRQLAEKWGISEGTIRNYLFYASASKLRNDYANLAKLNKKQVKLYLNIAEYAKPVADYWLTCGAIEDALIWFSDEKFDEKNLTLIASYFIEIMKQGAEKTLSYKTDFIPLNLSPGDQKRCIQKFKNGIKRAYKMARLKKRMAAYFNLGNDSSQKVTEYLDLYFNHPLSLKMPEVQKDTLFSLVIKRTENKLEFILTPEELKQCMELGKDEGYKTVIDKVRVLIAKKYNIVPSEIKVDSDGGIERQLDDLEIEMKAPDYVKQAKWPITRTFKVAFLGIKVEDEELRKTHWELLEKRWTSSDFNRVDEHDQYAVKEKMLEILKTTERKKQEEKDNEALREKSEAELAEIFVKKTSGIFDADEAAKKTFIEKLVNNFSKDFLYLFVYLASKYYDERQWQEKYKAILEGIHTVMKPMK